MSRDPQNPSSAAAEELNATLPLAGSAELAAGHLLAERFKILHKQGQGRFGAVYKAFDNKLNTAVAIKVLHKDLAEDPAALSNFKREILLLRQLSHPNIVRVHEYYHDAPYHFITMDWVDGESLEAQLQRGPLPAEEVISLLNQLLTALCFTEQQGMVHRDIKPDNLLINREGKLLIVDFGFAQILDSKTQSLSAATPIYAAPEYLQSGKVENSIDRYAAAVILYRMSCDQLPFSGDSIEQLIDNKFHTDFRFKPNHPQLKYLKPLLQQMLSPIPEQRPKSAESVLSAVNQPTSKPILGKPALVSAIAALLLITTLVFNYWEQLFPSSPALSSESKTYYSVAILPFYSKQQTLPVELSSDINDYLQFHLKQHPKLRLIESARLQQTLNLLGYQPPLSNPQYQLLSDLLQVDYLISTQVLFNQKAPTAIVESVEVDGNDVLQTPLLKQPLTQAALDSFVNNLSAKLLHRLAISQTPLTQLKQEGHQVEQLTRVHRLILQQQWQQAEQLLSQQLQQTSDHAALWYALAQALTQQNKRQLAEQALISAKRNSQPNTLIHQLASAKLNQLADKGAAAESIYQQLHQAFPANTQVLFELSEHFINTQQFADAEATLQKVVAIDTHHPVAWYELAKVAIWSGNASKAINDYLVKALVIAKRLKHASLQGDLLNAFGVAYQRLGDLDAALDYYQQGLKLRQQTTNTRGMATSLSNMAAIHSIRGEHNKAGDYITQSLALYRQLDDQTGVASAYNELGLVAEEQGHYQQALTHYRHSLTIRMNLDDKWLTAESMNNVGYIYFLLSDQEHAQIYWQQAKQAYQQVQDPVGVIRIDENLGQLALARGRWRQAYKLFNQALAESEKLNLLEEKLVAQAFLSRLSFLQGNIEHSGRSLKAIVSQLKQRDDVRGIIEFSLWLAEWENHTGAQDSATSRLSGLKSLVDSHASNEQRVFYNLLTNQIHSQQSLSAPLSDEAGLEHNIPDSMALKLLLAQSKQVLSQQPEKFIELTQKIERFDLSMYRFEQLFLHELKAAYYVTTENWPQVKIQLDLANQLTRTLGSYWRSFQLSRIRALWQQSQGIDHQAMQQQALKELNHLLQQIPPTQHAEFFKQQNYINFNDNLMELINRDSRK